MTQKSSLYMKILNLLFNSRGILPVFTGGYMVNLPESPVKGTLAFKTGIDANLRQG